MFNFEESDSIIRISRYRNAGLQTQRSGGFAILLHTAIDVEEDNPAAVKNFGIGFSVYTANIAFGHALDKVKLVNEASKAVINGAVGQGSGIVEDK